MGKQIILVHGRSYKPKKATLRGNWVGAVKHGISRDYNPETLDLFKKTSIHMAYYGDLSNKFLEQNGRGLYTEEDEVKDTRDRKAALSALKKYEKNEFTKSNYKKIRDMGDILKEAAADLISGPASIFGIGDDLISLVAPDMQHYWNPDTEFGSEVRWTLTELLVPAIKARDDILLVGHSLGTLVCYDVLWKLSHYGEYKYLRELPAPKIVLITIGSPLGDENVKRELKGADANGERKYPQNIMKWINFAAEDDFISHDPTVANDFKSLTKTGQKPRIKDRKIYNMSIRDEDSNPHHSTGYLIHPKFVKEVVEWLRA